MKTNRYYRIESSGISGLTAKTIHMPKKSRIMTWRNRLDRKATAEAVELVVKGDSSPVLAPRSSWILTAY